MGGRLDHASAGPRVGNPRQTERAPKTEALLRFPVHPVSQGSARRGTGCTPQSKRSFDFRRPLFAVGFNPHRYPHLTRRNAGEAIGRVRACRTAVMEAITDAPTWAAVMFRHSKLGDVRREDRLRAM